jgi:selenide,water dikinase
VLAGHGKQLVSGTDFDAAVEWMTTLNADAASALRPFSPNAVTDVTGFGLFGHAHEMAERSGVRIVLDALPALGAALDVARAGVRTGGDPRNREFAPIDTDGAAEELLAQTAGGLLISLPAEKGLSLRAEFEARGLFLARVGSVEAGAGIAFAPSG